MTAFDILIDASFVTGWDDESLLHLVCEYVDGQADIQSFHDFVGIKVAEETAIIEEE
jgi:hypothetical protein